MASHPAARVLQRFWPPKPWPVMGIGVGITLVGLLLAAFGDALAGARFICFLVGLLTAGVAVSMRLKTAGQAFEERMESAGVLAVGAFAGLLAFLGTDRNWESMQMALVVLVFVALMGVVLVLLPTPTRLLVVSGLVLIHFGGILTAATNTGTNSTGPPWVSQSMHQWVYRPYLEFMYLNNAYHFYSPEPGPPAVVWFLVRYQDGKATWFKCPDRDTDPVPMHHMRLLSIAEYMSQSNAQAPTEANLKRMNYIRGRRDEGGLEPGDWIRKKKADGSTDFRGGGYGIPIAPDAIVPAAAQYEEPTEECQVLIESYVRHVASDFATRGGPDNPIKSIKVYRFRHDNLMPWRIAAGEDPLDPVVFRGYYDGEYGPDGVMLHPDLFQLTERSMDALRQQRVPEPVLVKLQSLHDDGAMDMKRWQAEVPRVLGPDDSRLLPAVIQSLEFVSRQDPFLYWYVPIYYVDAKGMPVDFRKMTPREDWKRVDSLTRHAHLDLDKPPDQQSDDPNDSPWIGPAEKRP